MQTVLKIGGLLFSSGLTLSLFTRLFGVTPFGLIMALAALALFEGGAFGWARLLPKAREAQRTVAGTCLVIAVGLSLFSSGAEIIMATRLGADALKALDFEFLTLCAIVIALASNVIGALAFDAAKPETRRAAQKLAFEGRLAEMQYKAQTQIMDAAELDADLRVETRAPELARLISDRALSDTQRAVVTLSTVGKESDEKPAPALAAPGWPVGFRAVAGGSEATHQPAPVQTFAHVANAAAPLERWQEDDEPTPSTPPSAPATEAAQPAPKAARPKAKPGRKPSARNG